MTTLETRRAGGRTGTADRTRRHAPKGRGARPSASRERAKADDRANLTLATLGAVLTALLTAITTGVLTPAQYAVLPQLLLWTGCAACAPSLFLLSLAAGPRPTVTVKHRRTRHAMLWGAAFLALTAAGTLTGTLT
ncbi:hypothetical protein [Streptomyces sp. NPDC057398]|uniref:hypothetical protein n=1 Tax=Streptomyces sp. NPDC057398 TaxID=3346118 RepID=UPI00367D605E